AKALENCSSEKLVELMKQSHESLRNDYEVSWRELDVMDGIANDSDGVFGARMTGGGFGGCTINIVRTEAIEEFSEQVRNEYQSATQIDPDVYVVKADGGAREERV